MFVCLFVGLFASIFKEHSKNVSSSERIEFGALSEPQILCLSCLVIVDNIPGKSVSDIGLVFSLRGVRLRLLVTAVLTWLTQVWR